MIDATGTVYAEAHMVQADRTKWDVRIDDGTCYIVGGSDLVKMTLSGPVWDMEEMLYQLARRVAKHRPISTEH